MLLRGLVLLALVLGATVVASADQFYDDSHRETSPVLNAEKIADPGKPPTFNAGDYDAYRKPGSGWVYGRIAVHYADGKSLECGQNDVVALIPYTLYTWWAVKQWAFDIDGHRLRNWNMLFPNHLPDFLQESNAKSILHVTMCRKFGTGDFEIDNVPPGKYLIVTNVEDKYVDDSYPITHLVQQDTPYGMQEYSVYDGLGHGGPERTTYYYGYAVSIPGYLEVLNGQGVTFRESSVGPIAHLLGPK